MRRITFVLRTLALVALPLLAFPSAAKAAGATERPKLMRVGADVGFMAKKVFGTKLLNLSPEFNVLITAIPNIDIGLDWGLTFTRADPGGGAGSTSDTRIANPYISLHYGAGNLKIGGGVALPVGDVDSLNSGINYGTAAAIRGFRNPWVWTPDTLTIVAPSIKYEISAGPVEFGTDGAVAIFVPTENTDARDIELGLQYAVFAALDVAVVRPGVRFGGYSNFTGDDLGGGTQLYVEPFVGLSVGVADLSASLLMPLDDPAGFAFDDDGFYGLRIGASIGF